MRGASSKGWPHEASIRAMMLDLDGTLVQTESLKAISYDRITVALCP